MARHDEMVVPVNHDVMSSVGTTVMSSGKSGLSGLLKGAVGTFLIGTLLTVAATVGVAFLSTATLGGVLAVGATAVVGGLLTWGATTVGATLGSAIGLVGGGLDGIRRVSHEKGASQVLQAQVAAYQAAAASQTAQTNIYTSPMATNDNKFNFPAQGSAMNPASASIQAASAEAQGVVNGQQLQRA